MKFRTLGILLCALATFVFAACTTSPARELSHELPPYTSLPSGHEPLKPEELMPNAMPADVNAVEDVIPTNGILTAREGSSSVYDNSPLDVIVGA